MKVSKDRYLQTFGIVAIILALYRCAFPEVAHNGADAPSTADSTAVMSKSDSTADNAANESREPVATPSADNVQPVMSAPATIALSTGTPHPIYSVPNYKTCFPDSQEVHLVFAERYGVKPVADRADAERRMNELVFIGADPYFSVDDMRNGIPYLVPRAANLVHDIGRTFFDSLYVKGIPLHRFIITSALRTEADVERLRHHNGNATERSCHLFGTTIDIAQNRYETVQAPGHPRRAVSNDTLKWVLSEVLRDYREANRCCIKYEVKQGCFHITVK